MDMEALLSAARTHHREGRLDAAEMLYREVIEACPTHSATCVNLARLLMRRGGFEDAIRWLKWAAEYAPGDVETYRFLGLAYASSKQHARALDAFCKILEHAPDDIATLQIVANLQQELGLTDEAHDTFRRLHRLQPVFPIAASRNPPDFRVLMLFAPGAGNTPFEFLISGASFETMILSVVSGTEHDFERLGGMTDVVVNLVSDVDLGETALPNAAHIAERIGRPVVNHPDRIVPTDRESIARRLDGIAGCIVPRVRRVSTDGLRAARTASSVADVRFPCLVRPTGKHGGKDFYKVLDAQHLEGVLRHTDAPNYYVTQFVDYRSPDGYFRKYRFLFVDGEVLPYHLAIGNAWKVHHATTDMADHAWMRDEERAFLADPRHVFDDAQLGALREIQARIGLDYFGVDCGIDREGRVVVFEVNASMLVHGQNAEFPYKHEAVERIRLAFHAMLERKAVRTRAA
ncbi:tetratricopeptide repeat protein [Pararobbsia silviterrae]|nr:tetratricopeptide repeat protein [Pararobbsia silviterrae]